jgi:hypothetical protein
VPFHPELWRGLLATALTINFIVVAVKWPKAAVFGVLLYLPFMALIRRLLISEAGWTGNDPLLLVGPLVAVFLVYRLFLVEKRQLAPDRLSKLVVLLLIVALLGALNPIGSGGLLGGLGGLMFLGVPLLWFFIGRELPDERMVSVIMTAAVVMAVVIGAYGLYQTEYGSMPRWDLDWFHITGYGAVVADKTAGGTLLFRPWGTLSSGSEYVAILGIGWAIAFAMVLHRRYLYAVALPFFGVAIVSSGGRSVLALSLLTAVVMLALRTRNAVVATIVVVLGIGATYGTAIAFGGRLDRAANLSGDTGAKRQTGGLLNPLDPNKSSFLGHWDNAINAVKDGFTNPAGNGTGATNLGGRLGGSGGVETDIDIGDAFVSWGLFGGVLFLVIIFMSFRTVFRRYLRGPPDPLVFATAGVLIVSFGQWLQGGHYAASAFLWFFLGWAARPSAQQVERESEPVAQSLARRFGRRGKRQQRRVTA